MSKVSLVKDIKDRQSFLSRKILESKVNMESYSLSDDLLECRFYSSLKHTYVNELAFLEYLLGEVMLLND